MTELIINAAGKSASILRSIKENCQDPDSNNVLLNININLYCNKTEYKQVKLFLLRFGRACLRCAVLIKLTCRIQIERQLVLQNDKILID